MIAPATISNCGPLLAIMPGIALPRKPRISVSNEIRSGVAEAFDLQAYAVVLVREASLPKTSSGKLQRFLCRQQYLDGALKVLAQWRATRTI